MHLNIFSCKCCSYAIFGTRRWDLRLYTFPSYTYYLAAVCSGAMKAHLTWTALCVQTLSICHFTDRAHYCAVKNVYGYDKHCVNLTLLLYKQIISSLFATLNRTQQLYELLLGLSHIRSGLCAIQQLIPIKNPSAKLNYTTQLWAALHSYSF